MESKKIVIFNYADYRHYLRDFYNREKETNKNFSHRFINQKVGASSSGWFSDLIKARNKLSPQYFTKLCHLLGLNHKEIEYFEVLVGYDESLTLEDKNRYFEKILGFKEINAELVGKDKFEYYSKWYYCAIRELLFFYDFKGNYKALGKKLDPAITSQEAKSSIDLLGKLGLINKNAQGCFKPTSIVLKKDTSEKSLGLSNLLFSQMKLGAESLDRIPSRDRDVSSVTISYSKQGFLEVKDEIKRLKKKLLVIAEKDLSPSKVYQLNIQLFPISKENTDE